MSDRVTDAQAAEWRAPCEAATEGPWFHADNDIGTRVAVVSESAWRERGGKRCVVARLGSREGITDEDRANAALIAVARAALPALLDEREELRTQLRAARGCPCLYTEPCHPQCTCAHEHHSGGCWRCARYGSEEQRRARAEGIAHALDAAAKR